MTDPWTPPDAPPPPGWGWGPPPAPPNPARQWVPAAVVVAVAVLAAAAVVALRPPEKRQEPAAGAPVPTAVRTPTPTPSPTPARAVPSPKPVRTASPKPAKTYSAPPEGVAISGRVVDANGRPVPGAVVTMQRDEGWAGAFARGITALFTLGLACLADVCTVPYGEGRTDGNGRYTLFLERETSDYHLTVSRRDGPALDVGGIAYRGQPLRMPDAVYWDPGARLELDGTRARLRYRSPPASVGSWRGATARVTDSDDDDLVVLDDVESGEAFDARLIEDTQVRATVRLGVRTRLGDATYTSRTSLVRGRWRPASRGKACLEYGKSGRAVRNAPCDLTDGDLLARWDPKVPNDWQCSNGSPCDRKVDVDLGSARRLTYVVVRECGDFFDSVEVSTDGRTWRTVIEQHSGDGGDMHGVCAREIDVVARYVRVNGPAGGFYSRRREISAF